MTEMPSSQIFYFTVFVPSSFLKQWYLASLCSPFQDYLNNKHQLHSKETKTVVTQKVYRKETSTVWIWTPSKNSGGSEWKLTRIEYLVPQQKGKMWRHTLAKLSQVKEQKRWTKVKSRSWCKRWKESCLDRRVSLKKAKPQKKYLHICSNIYTIKIWQTPCYAIKVHQKKKGFSFYFTYMWMQLKMTGSSQSFAINQINRYSLK